MLGPYSDPVRMQKIYAKTFTQNGKAWIFENRIVENLKDYTVINRRYIFSVPRKNLFFQKQYSE